MTGFGGKSLVSPFGDSCPRFCFLAALVGISQKTVLEEGTHQSIAAGQLVSKLLDEVVLLRNLLPDFGESFQGFLMLLNHAGGCVDTHLGVVTLVLRLLRWT